MDFMELLEKAAEDSRRAFGMDDAPQLVARAQAQNRREANEEPMLMANLVNAHRPAAAQCEATVERESDKPFAWGTYLQGLAMGAVLALLVVWVLI